jgi:hypothetical protein
MRALAIEMRAAPVPLKAELCANDAEATTAAPRFEELPAGLDWARFSARRFPNGRRHDLEAMAAYFAYKQLPREAAGCKSTAEGIEAWEDEGGSTR